MNDEIIKISHQNLGIGQVCPLLSLWLSAVLESTDSAVRWENEIKGMNLGNKAQ